MEISEKHFCVILAGGKGRRLWPCSREEKPKQFIDFFGTGRTQLQATFDRFARLMPASNIYVCTNQEYAPLVREQLPELQEEQLMIEVVNRNTSASVSWAMLNIQKRMVDASIVIAPSDQFVTDDIAFEKNIRDGFDIVDQRDMVLAMGVTPTRPEPGYGYIQMGSNGEYTDVYRVKSFSEKPDRDFARLFMESGEFLWNTGLMLCRATYLRHCLRKIFFELFAPGMCENNTYTIDQVLNFIQRNYASLPNVAIDQGLFGQAEEMYVMKCDFGWADLGTWHSIYEGMQKGEGDNVVVDSEVMLENCRDNIIKMPKGHLAVINGLEGYIVAEAGDVLLICPKGDSSALIRKYVNEVRLKYGDEYV
jgi:mannose-1-phosphate guanylyltransferase